MPSLHFQDIIVSDSGNTCKKLRKHNKSAVFFKREKCALMPDTSGIYGKRVFSRSCCWSDPGRPKGHPVHPPVAQKEGSYNNSYLILQSTRNFHFPLL